MIFAFLTKYSTDTSIDHNASQGDLRSLSDTSIPTTTALYSELNAHPCTSQREKLHHKSLLFDIALLF